MATLGTPPRGLLSLLALRDFGDVPREIPNTVLAGIDITQFLLLNRETIDGGGLFIAAVGAFDLGSAFTVPAGELWYIHEFSVLIDCNAGSTCTAYPFYQETANVGVSVGLPVSVPASTRGFVRDADQDRWAVPGAVFRLYVAAFTGAPSCAGAMVISRLRI